MTVLLPEFYKIPESQGASRSDVFKEKKLNKFWKCLIADIYIHT